MLNKKSIISSLFLFFHFFYAPAQTINGKIVSSDGSPIASAIVKYQYKININAVTNRDGDFLIPDAKVGDTISVEAIGFDHCNYILTNKDFNEGRCSIVLQIRTSALPEVTVTSGSAKNFLFQALKKTRTTLPENVLYKAYYREYMKFESKIKKYADGVLNIKLSKIKAQFSVVNSRVIDALSEEDGVFDKKYRSLFIMDWLVEDFFPENVSSALKEKETADYIYKFKDRTDSSFVINICPNENNSNEVYKQVDVYINANDTTIRNIAITLIPSKKGTVVKKNLVSSMKPIDLMYVTHYINDSGFIQLTYVKMMTNANITLLGSIHNVETVSELFVDSKLSQNEYVDKPYKYNFLYQNGNQNATVPFWKDFENRVENTQDIITFIEGH